MKRIATATAIIVTLAAAMPASAGGGWHGRGCWGNCGGIGPWGAVGLGLGAFALGSALANPYWYYQPQPWGAFYPQAAAPTPYYYPQSQAPIPLHQCWNSYTQSYYGC